MACGCPRLGTPNAWGPFADSAAAHALELLVVRVLRGVVLDLLDELLDVVVGRVLLVLGVLLIGHGPDLPDGLGVTPSVVLRTLTETWHSRCASSRIATRSSWSPRASSTSTRLPRSSGPAASRCRMARGRCASTSPA